MNPMDLQGLLAIPNNEAADLQRQGVNLANAMQIPGGVAAMNAPLIGRSAQQNVAKMFGMDVRTTAQKAQEALKGVSINTPEGQKQAVSIIQQIDPARAVALQTYFEQANMTAKERGEAQELAAQERANIEAQRLAMSRMAIQAKNPQLAELVANGGFDGKAKDFMGAIDSPGGSGGGLASAKTEILGNGTVIKVLPNGQTVVEDPTGRVVTGAARQAAIQAANEAEVAGEQRNAQMLLAAQRGDKYVDRVQQLKESSTAYDEAIQAIDDGATTGYLQNMLPSFRESTIRLENIQKQMGLDVVSASTFGALSEGELGLALSKALPTSLKPEDLREWLVNKRDAQMKLMSYMEDAAIYLSSGHTSAEWIKAQREMAREEPAPVTPKGGGSRFIVEDAQ